MKAEDAGNLLKKAFNDLSAPAVWADLGCGSGTFTRALSNILPTGSSIFASDKEPQDLRAVNNKVQIHFQKADFEKDVLLLPPLDGILMANALHYVTDKILLLARLKTHFKHSGQFLLIEYDTDISNPWVPYPISYLKLRNVLLKAGFLSIEKLEEMPSAYSRANIYSCIVRI